jgi:16S rRNA G966 N2-methylase RsmD
LRANLEKLGLRTGFRIHSGSVKSFLQKLKPEQGFDLVFLDPPYDAAQEYAGTLGLLGGAASGALAPGALVVAEHRRKEKLEDRYGSLKRTRLLEQGDAALSFYGVDGG